MGVVITDRSYVLRISALCLAGVALVVSGCGFRADDDHGVKFNAVPAYVEEYRAATVDRPLPPGRTWPPEPPGEKSGRYQAGVGKSDADNIWQCEWTEEWLRQRGRSGPRAATALKNLEGFRETHLYRVSLDQIGRDWYEAGMRGAQLGDPTEFQRFAEINC